jgi:hypothetical protein
MTAICPKDPTHRRFITRVHAVNEWVVDPNGKYIQTLAQLEFSIPTGQGNVWTCAECATPATMCQDEDVAHA